MSWGRLGKAVEGPGKRPSEENEGGELGQAPDEVSMNHLHNKETGAQGGGAPCLDLWLSVPFFLLSRPLLESGLQTLTHMCTQRSLGGGAREAGKSFGSAH